MRIIEIKLKPIVLQPGEASHIACGWSGCRGADLHTTQAAGAFATYKIRTGRVQAGLWKERIMPLCSEHEKAFKEKYMQNLCPNCKHSPVDENSASGLCEACSNVGENAG